MNFISWADTEKSSKKLIKQQTVMGGLKSKNSKKQNTK
jgi:hypothetical protein